MLRIAGQALAAVVASAAAIAGFAPHIFLRVPNVGFILYAMAGGNVPPFFATAPFEGGHFDQWARPGDVVISGGAKSGTTWTMNIMHQIRSRGDDSFADIQDMVPWMDQLMYPGQTWEDMLSRLKREEGFSETLPYRVVKSHEHPPRLPVKDGVKYVVVIRNATDVMASVKPFFPSFSKEFRDMWGGFPPAFPNDDAFYDWWLKDAGNGESAAQQFYFSMVKAWWPHRNRPNVMLVHYSDLRNSFDESLGKLCQFLGVELNEEEKARVVDFTSIGYMKKYMHKFESDSNLKAAKELGFISQNATTFATRGMVRKGGVGTGAKELAAAKVQEFRNLHHEQMGGDPAMERWASFGGEIPA